MSNLIAVIIREIKVEINTTKHIQMDTESNISLNITKEIHNQYPNAK